MVIVTKIALEIAPGYEKKTESGHKLIIAAISHCRDQRGENCVFFVSSLLSMKTLSVCDLVALVLHAGQSIG